MQVFKTPMCQSERHPSYNVSSISKHTHIGANVNRQANQRHEWDFLFLNAFE